MSSVSCPHCGTQNPSSSGYCARCQRPLGRSAAGTSSLAPASQVAQQILQKRPPVPTTEQAKPLPSAAEVAASLMRKRAAEQAASSVERTVVERAPQPPPQRSRPAPPPQAPTTTPTTPPARSSAAPRPPEKTTSQARRAELSDDEANEPTAVFATPTSLHDDPTRNNQRLDPPTQRSAVPQALSARPAAAPALPQPVMARDMPVKREPVAKPPPKRAPAPQPMSERRGTASGNATPGQVLREGALPPRRPAPQPPEASAYGFEYAAGWRLLLSHLVDLALVALVFWFFANIDAALSGPHGVRTSGIFDWIGVHPGSTLRAAIITTLLGTTYHVIMLQLGGRTVGRLLAGTILRRRSGKPLNAFVITVRTVASFVSLGLFGAGFFWSIVDRRGRGFHDLVSGTMVVRYRGA